MNWNLEVVTLLNSLVIPAKTLRLGMYLLEEMSVVLLAIATAAVVILFLLAALVLFFQGARLGFLWLRVGAAQTAVSLRNLSGIGAQ